MFNIEEEVTPLQQSELDALLLDRMAVIKVVSALRKYREVIKGIAASRYSDGAVDGPTLSEYLTCIEDIEKRRII